MHTALISEPISGNKLYQQRARAALPLLVRQAEAGNTIFYSDLADELGMPNPRNLNFVLGSIGQTMENLSKSSGKHVPPIQCLVVNRATGFPGEGIGWFLEKPKDFVALPKGKQRALVKAALQQVYAYPYWHDVLEHLNLQPAGAAVIPQNQNTPSGFGGGESPAHKALKEYVALHPDIVGLHPDVDDGETEAPLLSGDSLDVSFTTPELWVAAEVKSRISDALDIQRGLFQCIKYKAVMQAQALAEARHIDVRVVLVLEATLPQSLLPLKNMFAIEVVENVAPRP